VLNAALVIATAIAGCLLVGTACVVASAIERIAVACEEHVRIERARYAIDHGAQLVRRDG
jgi:hypothetical protein